MERRLKPVRTVAMGGLVVSLVASAHWMGWWPVLICIVVGLGFVLVDLRLDDFHRPELAIATMWLIAQVAIGASIWLTGGADSPAVAWLAIPVVTLPARFDMRGVIAGVILTAVILAVVTIVPDPSILIESPEYVMAPAALLFAVAILSTALMRSDIDHRTESVIDGLTGMLNRRALDSRLAELSAQARVTGEPIGVIIGDLDHFKQVNDQYGHAAGDAVLVDVAYTLRKELRAFDLAYRLGGEEFLVVLPGATLEESTAIAEQLREAVSTTPAGGRHITMSFGVAGSGGDGFDDAAVLHAADGALYEAKHGGRDRVATAGVSGRSPVLA
jgi:diguanylate cyclase (GGDEF)-like protein